MRIIYRMFAIICYYMERFGDNVYEEYRKIKYGEDL